ncbi:unnamed protein product [Polarella glacialis]|uniref:Uncharacterized protein n=1 Tax=Polarella glacialis TaxID=89957 RepID=A0A813JQK5_POLGL|nr:unnamed protein product [Polarella glacialis]
MHFNDASAFHLHSSYKHPNSWPRLRDILPFVCEVTLSTQTEQSRIIVERLLLACFQTPRSTHAQSKGASILLYLVLGNLGGVTDMSRGTSKRILSRRSHG